MLEYDIDDTVKQTDHVTQLSERKITSLLFSLHRLVYRNNKAQSRTNYEEYMPENIDYHDVDYLWKQNDFYSKRTFSLHQKLFHCLIISWEKSGFKTVLRIFFIIFGKREG